MRARCIFIKRKILDHSEGLLTDREKNEVGKHLESCAKCRALLAKMEESARALEALREFPVRISDSFKERAVRNITSAEPKRRPVIRFSPSIAASLSAIAALILILVILVAIKPWGLKTTRTQMEPTVSQEFKANKSTPEGLERSGGKSAADQTATAPMPEKAEGLVVPSAVEKNANYNKDSIRNMVENLALRKEVAESMTMGHSMLYSATYAKRLADEFTKINEDGALIEAMISYITRSEPVLLPFYGEKALYEGRDAFIIVFAGPPRTGESVALSRCEVWVLEPSSFKVNPDSSILLFLEHKF